jgi:hypothetical protein
MYGHRRYREWPARPVGSRARRAARTRERFPRSPAARLAFFAKGSLYEGAKYPRSSADTMNRRGLPACPKRSIMGTGGDTLTLVLQTR